MTDKTIGLEKEYSFDIARLIREPAEYLNAFFTNRLTVKSEALSAVLKDIHQYNGLLSIREIANRNFTTVRQLERMFKLQVGLTPKEYSNIIRFQNALSVIKGANKKRSLLDIAYDCGYYDHAHLTNEIRENTGMPPFRI